MTFKDRIIHTLLNLVFKRRDIEVDGQLYMRRWYLRGAGTDSQWFLHNIRLADSDRQLHDHPFDFTTRILSGGYIESVIVELRRPVGLPTMYVTKNQLRGAGEKVANPAEHTHRLAWVDENTWTLVHAGPARREWGFLTIHRNGVGIIIGGEWKPASEVIGPDAARWLEDRVRS